MLIPVSEMVKKLGIEPNGVLHVGAHLAEEAPDYEYFKWVPVTWVESQHNLVLEISKKLDPALHRVIEATVWDVENQKLVFKKTSSTQSSSLLSLGTHLSDYPEIKVEEEYEVNTTRLDKIISLESTPSFLNLDIQGAEGKALKSLGKNITRIKFIYTEVNKAEVYIDCTKVSDIDNMLREFGFYRAVTRWKIGKGWGDALYLRNSDYKPLVVFIKLANVQAQYYIFEWISYLKLIMRRTLFRI
jgi:FkbM family methyltransferase